MFFCTCPEFGITKINFISQIGEGKMSTLGDTAAELAITKDIPWLGRKAVVVGRYYGSGALRNPRLQKKAVDYALDKLQ